CGAAQRGRAERARPGTRAYGQRGRVLLGSGGMLERNIEGADVGAEDVEPELELLAGGELHRRSRNGGARRRRDRGEQDGELCEHVVSLLPLTVRGASRSDARVRVAIQRSMPRPTASAPRARR